MSEALRPDLCIIGAGAAGLSLAASAAAFGVPTVLVERGEMGGECLNTACVPSKALIAAARAARPSPLAPRLAKELVPPALEHQRVLSHVNGVVADIAPADSAARYAALGVEVIKAEAAFTERTTVRAGDKLVKARRFVIASGSEPAIPEIAGLDAVPFLTNETVFALQEPPRHLLVIGAGTVGCELGQAFRRLGSEVTLFEQGRLLPQEDEELVGVVRAALERDGVSLREEIKLAAVAAAPDGVRLHYSDETSAPRQTTGSHLLIAAGRSPRTYGLGLEEGFIKYDKSGIIVDHGMRTSNPRVFAIGDCVGGDFGGCRFTHAASLQASVVIRSAFFRLPSRFDPLRVPRVTFTDPEVASVGLSEGEARSKHGDIRVCRFALGETDRARAEGEREGLVKLVSSPNGRLLGAAICGKGAGEMIPLWTLALKEGMKLSKIASLVTPYPTLSDASRRAALEFYTPMARRPILRRLMGVLRKFG
ncbi:MAG: FAD-dependent oxidoreductase [Hyphomicrobiales bacterium]|nr:FAD-dependent oxidoreductase [Hyphomicrobiales bacterium]MBV9517754.1 FAD-dependent oxidoreductase [Hyphomicrobiales bacterium]